MAIVRVLFGRAAAMKTGRITVAAIIPILALRFVGAAFLADEKAYRDLYNTVVPRIRKRTYGLNDYRDLTATADAEHYRPALSS